MRLDEPVSDVVAQASTDLVRKHERTEVAYSTVATETKKGKKWPLFPALKTGSKRRRVAQL